ncbi:hypothetical protein CRENBAI_017154 [Crenichthys baileyi]|uniref:Uncharacterized protein n=1 Tax=Crenichthys baileyi TaxID=28760 RepID=A0AAV9RX84_9TELE
MDSNFFFPFSSASDQSSFYMERKRRKGEMLKSLFQRNYSDFISAFKLVGVKEGKRGLHAKQRQWEEKKRIPKENKEEKRDREKRSRGELLGTGWKLWTYSI